MATYEVIEAESKGQRPDKGYGPMQVIALSLRGESPSAPVIVAEWYTKATTPIPTPGSSVDGDVTQGKFGMQFKKAKPEGSFAGGGGSTWKPRDPKDTAAIQRQHSQEMALRYLAIQQSRGKVSDTFTLDGLKAIVDWFELDIKNAPQVYGEPLARKDSEQTGQSDVPLPAPDEFVHPPAQENEMWSAA